jgi:heme/copper-type cytochrome/quinol oxidase subunit 4
MAQFTGEFIQFHKPRLLAIALKQILFQLYYFLQDPETAVPP